MSNGVDEKSRRASVLTISEIEALDDDEILALSMERPGHPGQRGFLLNPRHFRSEVHLAEITHALMARLIKAEKGS